MNKPTSALWGALTSLKLTIGCLAALMVLVVACTLAQVKLGTWGAVEVYMRAWLVWTDLPFTHLRVPVFPGGALVGLVLLVNLVAAQARRLELSWKKSGLWLSHAGLVLLVAGEFVTGVAQRETQLAVEEGQTVNFVEAPRDMELAVIDTTDPSWDEVHSIPATALARRERIEVPGTPVVLNVLAYHRNAELRNRAPQDPPALADQGIGANVSFRPLAPVSRDEEVNSTVAVVEPVVAGEAKGRWLVSNALGARQRFTAGGREYELELRHRREYLPYAITLKDFSHDVYAGTSIPKNFSSLVRITNPSRGEARDVLIYMNQPLRYEGKAFYQSSFGKNDTLSILQVVENPGWLLPYVSTVLVMLGLGIHFGISLRRWMRRRAAANASAVPAAAAAEA